MMKDTKTYRIFPEALVVRAKVNGVTLSEGSASVTLTPEDANYRGFGIYIMPTTKAAAIGWKDFIGKSVEIIIVPIAVKKLPRRTKKGASK